VAENAQDVVQEVFCELVERSVIRNEPLPVNPLPYLLRMAHYISQDKWRQHYRVQRAAARDERREEGIVPLGFTEAYIEREWIADALGRLAEVDRRLLLLRYTQELTHEEIAQQTDLAAPTVRQRCHRALRRLRSVMESPPVREPVAMR
jgi:RNA polymerase sigma-70 factor (ECF subfamily)